MYSGNAWGGSFDIAAADGAEDDHSRNMDLDRGALSARQHLQQLDETQQSWLLGPPEAKKKDKYVDLGCVVVKRKLLWWIFWGLVATFVLIGLPVIIAKSIPKKKPHAPPADQYTDALHKALLFFNAQKLADPEFYQRVCRTKNETDVESGHQWWCRGKEAQGAGRGGLWR